ncbi:hypothetical protein oki298_06270 [Helicobacter pylori]
MGGLSVILKTLKSARRFIFNYSYSKKTLYKHMRVGLNDKWDNQKLENKRIISSYEIYNSESGLPFRPIAQLQEVGLVELSLNSLHLILPQTH